MVNLVLLRRLEELVAMVFYRNAYYFTMRKTKIVIFGWPLRHHLIGNKFGIEMKLSRTSIERLNCGLIEMAVYCEDISRCRRSIILEVKTS